MVVVHSKPHKRQSTTIHPETHTTTDIFISPRIQKIITYAQNPTQSTMHAPKSTHKVPTPTIKQNQKTKVTIHTIKQTVTSSTPKTTPKMTTSTPQMTSKVITPTPKTTSTQNTTQKMTTSTPQMTSKVTSVQYFKSGKLNITVINVF